MHSESVTALLYTVNCYSVSFPIPCGHKVPIEVCKRSVGQAENIIKQERDGKSAALRQHAQPKSMSRTIKMDTLGIEPRASHMLSGCDTTTQRALEGGSSSFSSEVLLTSGVVQSPVPMSGLRQGQ